MTLIDTHSHIQFQIFDEDRDQVIKKAANVGVEKIIVVGTDIESSRKAVQVAENYPGIYASVGIHPHHVFNLQSSAISHQQEMVQLEQLTQHPKVVAVGETGMDTHLYPGTKYQNYQITEEFLQLQERAFVAQIRIALISQKTLIIHNRGSVEILLKILGENWDSFFEGRSVFHCCEPDEMLLDFAKKHQVFVGVDGDVTYDKIKQEFVRKIPSELLVLETDSPFFIPEPLISEGVTRNEPANLVKIADFIEQNINKDVRKMSRSNGLSLFNIS